jgi:two-component system response regulator
MPRGTILLVEDNTDDELLTLRALKKNNVVHEVVVARDGADALARVHGANGAAADVVPVLVLLDLKLPKLDGIEVLRALRADPRTSLVPVVVLTTSREEQGVVDAYRFGANSYVRKPVDYVEFNEAVRQLGLYWLLINEPPPRRGVGP